MRGGTQLSNAKRILTFVFENIDSMASLGAPIWPLEPSTVMHLWTTGRVPAGMRVVVITWDASEYGVAFSIRKVPSRIEHCVGRQFEHVSSVATFGSPLKVQAHREGWGGAKYGMGSRKHLAPNRWKRARKGLLQRKQRDSCRES